ncbi:unnamed protein product [Hapterophycus canaliculatus]
MASDNGLYLIPLSDGEARLFLGTQKAAQDRLLLRRHGISRIVCVGTPAFHQAGRAEGDEGDVDSIDDTKKGRSTDKAEAVGFLYLEIPILDLPSENLVGHLDRSAAFIAEGVRREENVLVNCVYAQSRSATVVTGYLMRQESLSLTQAMNRVKEAQPTVHINPGFEAQLELYRDLGCRLPGSKAIAISTSTCTGKVPNVGQQTGTDEKLWAASIYRWFTFASRLNTTGGNRDSRVLQPEGLSLLIDGGGGGTEGPVTTMLYRCKACRAPLFRDDNVLDHFHPVIAAVSDSIYASFSRHGDGSSWLKARNAAAATKAPASTKKVVAGAKPRQLGVRSYENVVGKGSGSSSSDRGVGCLGGRGSCSSIFTEPLDWVGITESGHRRGKITCPGRKTTACGSKLGAWSLEGTNCSCGRMVKPATQFTLSRVECVKIN